jgi:hypothetical protein
MTEANGLLLLAISGFYSLEEKVYILKEGVCCDLRLIPVTIHHPQD